MTERPDPDLDRVRDALRDHDEREPEAPEAPPEQDDEPGDDQDGD